jgi:UDP-galactopyranose mutase
MTSSTPAATLICLSHLRWNFVYQRPQHLMSRFARDYRVLFVEEPVYGGDAPPRLEEHIEPCGVRVLVPHLAASLGDADRDVAQRLLLDAYLDRNNVRNPVLWHYSPMSLPWTAHLDSALIVYDCMDELSAFRGAPAQLVTLEQALLTRADVVFTGGHSLYEAKRAMHRNVHAIPSSVDVAHFKAARRPGDDPQDQRSIGRPRLGFYGVLDERFDCQLLRELAALRPAWQFVLIGPVVKIDPAVLPRAPNIHYLGPKRYEDLPSYLRGWNVALMPFAMNESTRYISPTKTPEYLAGGVPVVSTPIADVVRTYGKSGVVSIAGDAPSFARAIANALKMKQHQGGFNVLADRALGDLSWDLTWRQMRGLMEQARRPARPLAGGRSAKRRFDYLIVGAGFAGSVLAERLATQLDKRVLLVDRRPHIGGNAYDYYNDDGVLVHRYGPHIFHTNAQAVVDYLSRFTQWRPYEHRVLASVDGGLVPMPINLVTLERLYRRSFSEAQAQAFLAAAAEPRQPVRTAEDAVVSTVGRELYEKFFRGYTRKQWGLDPAELDASVTARVPARTNRDDRYFTDRFQAMPARGYTRMFENMLDHPNISILLNTDFQDIRQEICYGQLIYSGPIDEYFDHRLGRLPYRSLRFHHETLRTEQFQPVAVVNFPSEDVPYTRITEYKHLTGQRHHRTSLTYEYPSAEGDPYYPIPSSPNAQRYKRYQQLADATPGVTFVGRLGTYRYYNMDQVVAQALAVYGRIVEQQEQQPSATDETAAAAP